MKRALAVLALILVPGVASAQRPRLPDSPTGRAVGGWLDLLGEPQELDAEGFAAAWLAPTAAEGAVARLERLLTECRGAQPRGARKTGPTSAEVMLVVPDAGRSCSVSFELEADPPHHIRSWSAEVNEGDEADHAGPEGPAGVTLPALDLPAEGEARKTVDAWLEGLAEQGLFSGSVLVARKDAVVFEGAYGLADRESGAAVELDTRFDVGSITKAITKTAVGQLLRDGKLRLSDTIQQHLPDYPNPEVGRRVTVEQLLEHTSGLGDIFNERFRETPKEGLIAPRDFFPVFADEALRFEPGTAREYSNAGYIVLGAIVEAVSSQDYMAYVQKHVFDLAGMTHSGFLRHDRTTPRLAVGYTRLTPEGERGELESNRGRLPIQGCPAGSSSHTARDLLHFDRALRDGTLLGPWTGWFFGDEAPAEGSGAESAEDAGYAFAGGAPGVNAMLESARDAVVVVLANLDPPVAGQVAEQLREAATRLSPLAPTASR